MQPRSAHTFTPVGDTDPFTPTPERPVRVRARTMPADTHFEPHRHDWAQLAYCATGVLQVMCDVSPEHALNTAHKPQGEITYIVPPSRAVWIAPGALHNIYMLERAALRTLYIDASVIPPEWHSCRVIMVSPLLRELIHALDHPSQAVHAAREAALTALVCDEIAHADIQSLGVPLPPVMGGDKRLRGLCEAVLRAPAARANLADWAADVGASERTMARLFRDELGTSYQQWRQQAVLAHALPMLARGLPVSQVAAASGYASDSAFSAMFKAAMGQPPSQFTAQPDL